MSATIGDRTTTVAARRIAAQARGIAEELGRKYTMALAMPAAALQHLVWFDAGVPSNNQPARPVLEFDDRMRQVATEAITQRMAASLRQSKTLAMLPALTVGGNAIRGVYVERLQTNGGDVPFAPLSPRYLASKMRRGLDLRTGIATGEMLRAVRGAQIVVTRTR